jgi:DNA-binding NarL/FixJ family response regulator
VVKVVPNEGVLSVWLVDDDFSCCENLSRLLSAEPRVNCSRSFSSATALLETLGQESPPDAILLDVQMPVMNGIEAIRPIKDLAPATRVLMLTSFSDHRLKEESLAAGAADFLLKRNPPAQIIAAIRAAACSG